MQELNPRAVIGGNMPPEEQPAIINDPLDDAIATDQEALERAELMLIGQPVDNDAMMKDVDDLVKRLKAIKKAVTTAKEAESKPLHDAWKTALARYKPTEDDLDRMVKGCSAMVDGYKRQKRAAQEEAQRVANMAAAKARREAEEAARQAEVSHIEAQREAEAKLQKAKDAEREAAAAKKDRVKGMRKVTRYEITEHRAALHDIAKNDRDAITAFVEEYVRRNHKTRAINGVKVWEDVESF